MSARWRLLADIGGTNIRFGLARDGQPVGTACEITDLQSWPSENFCDFDAALRAYLDGLDRQGVHFTSAAIAAAGPVTPQAISLTNKDWTITGDQLRQVLGHDIKTRLLNDLEAVAYALPFLTSDTIDWWDDRRPPSPLVGRQLALNVGTGFGSAALLATDGGWLCCPAESGHMHLSMADAHEPVLLRAFGSGDVTVEDVLSGNGACRLWRAVAETCTQSTGSLQEDRSFDFTVTGAAMAETRAIFSALLGRTAANLTLAATAWDGVYLCGSVAMAWAEKADRQAFRRAFSGTSKMRQRLTDTPIGLIRHPLPALVGLANIALS
ncbi:MAG: glucokinase [Hyphomicrobiaceae bacterium]